MSLVIGLTWLIFVTLGKGKKWIMGIKNFNLRSCQVTKRGKIGLNQFLIYIHPFPPLSPKFFYFLVFNSVAKRKLFLGRKIVGGRLFALFAPPQVTPVSLVLSLFGRSVLHVFPARVREMLQHLLLTRQLRSPCLYYSG
jgi:hypothetical protein